MQPTKRLLLSNWNSINNNIIQRNVASNTVSINVNDSRVKSWKEIPGPSSLPIIGQMHHFLPGQIMSDFKNLQENMCKRYGTIVRLDGAFGRPPTLFLYDVDACEFVLRSENWSPSRPGFISIEYYRKKYKKTPEQAEQLTGLLTDHGDKWRTFRTAVNPVMVRTDKILPYAGQLHEVAVDMVKRMKSIRDENNVIVNKFDQEMNLWALESIGVVALGGRLNCFGRDLADNSPEKRLIQCVHDTFHIANELDFKASFWQYFPTKTFRRGMKIYQEQEDLAKYFIQKARQKFQNSETKEDEEKGVLEKLLEIDERIAIIMVCDMLFAGVDTAANTMTSTLYLLAKNQEKQDKLRQAIASGDNIYVKGCLKESLRMMPTVGGNMRQISKDYIIKGYEVPKGTYVIIVNQFLSLLEEHFPRAQEYIPERWIEKGPLHYKNTNPFVCMPFGFGVRTCIGRRIAELEIETFLTEVIKNFKVEWTGPPPEVVASSMNYITGPFNFTFKDV